ncbi:alpha/beta fold hydrolase [Sandarakinorhabdus sp. DWP1-3-1]|uniref:alpha/beta fold hydrolase n=1 Tax=Sandarakinorhabdus sp. DWP1-3-1 TaxID=2804627 RepID=UPI003CF60FA8
MIDEVAWLDTRLFAPRPAAAMEADALTRPGMTFVDVVGARLRVRAQPGPGPTVVLLPDGPNTIEHYDPVFDRFAGRNAVLAVEIPGFGFSWASAPQALGFDGVVAAVIEAIDALAPASFIIVGACIQAYVAIAVAAARPDRVAGVVAGQATDVAGFRRWIGRAIDPAGSLRVPIVGQLAWARPENRHAMGADAWYHAAAGPDIDVAPWRELAHWSIDCGCSNALATVCQSWLPDDEWSPPVAQCPGVILFGTADRTHRHSDPEGLRAYLPNAVVRRLPRAGHFPELEALDTLDAAIAELSR